MWFHFPFLLLGLTCTTAGLKFPLPLLQRDSTPPRDTTSPSKPAGRGKLTPRKRLGSGVIRNESQISSKAARRDFVRPKVKEVGSVPERDNATKFRSDKTTETAKNILSGTTEVVVATLVNTGPANALLTPLHKWSSSRKRVAEAVEAAAAAAGEPRPVTAAERERRKQQRALFEGQEKIRTNPWLELLRDTVSVPEPVKNTYNALVSVAAVPGQLAQTGKQTAETLAVAAETVGAMPDRVRETVAQGQATVKTAQEVLAGAPDRLQEVVTATRELPGRVERAVEEGTEAVEAAVEVGRKAAEAVETLPSRLPDLMDTVADDALSLAEGTAAGVDAAGTALWGLTKEVAAWATDLVLRQALAPVHEFRTSARRVRAALDEEQAALPQASPPSRSSAEKAPSSPTVLVTAATVPPVEGGGSASRDDTSPDIGDSMPVSRLAELRGRFSSWRRKRRSIPAVAVADEDNDEGDDVENVVDSKETGVASSSLSPKPAISQEARTETASGAVQADSRIAAMRSDTGAQPLGEEVEVEATAKTPTAGNVLIAEGQVAAREALLPVTESVTGGSADAFLKKTVSPAPVGALAVSVASEDRGGVVKGAAPPAAARLPGAAGFEKESKETGADAEKRPVARVTAADTLDKVGLDQSAPGLAGDDEPLAGEIEVAGQQEQSQTASFFAGSSSSGGASSDTEERAQADAERADGTNVGGKGGDDTSREKNVPPSSRPVAVIARSKAVASSVSPLVDADGDDGGALLGGPDAKNELPASRGNPGETAAVEAVNDAEGAVTASAVPTATAGSTSRKQVAAEAVAAPLESGERSGSVVSPASLSSPVPVDTALSPRSSSWKEASQRKNGSDNLAAQKGFETPAKTEARDGPAGEAGPMVSAGKPPVSPSKVVNDETALAAGEAVPRVAGKGARVDGGGSGTLEGPNGAWNVMNPAAEFLKDWVEKAVPQKKAELKRRESAVCWERQWYPVAVVSELLQQQQQQQQRRFQMLGREYELAPIPHEGPRASPDFRGWGYRAVADPSDESDLGRAQSSVGPATAAARVPLRESNGLLWAWPDTSPVGLEAAEIARPAPIPDILGVGDKFGSSSGAWRRLLRRPSASQSVQGSNDEVGGGGQEAERENRGNQRYLQFVQREIPCGFSDAVRGLLAASHGQAVRALAAGGNEDGNTPTDDDLVVASELADGNESSSGVRAAFDTWSEHGEVLLSSPTVVEWRFSPAPRPAVDGTPAPVAQEHLASSATATKHEAAVSAVSSRRRGWLRRRLSGLGGGGRGSGGVVDRLSRVSGSAAGSDHRDRRAVEGRVRQGGGAHYVVSLLPVGPNRTKVFARLEVEPSGLLGGRAFWWSRRIRRALLISALDKVASGPSTATGGESRSRLLSSAAEAWLEGAADGGPF